MKKTPDIVRNAVSSGAQKAGKVLRYILSAILCCTALVLCITSGIMISQFANERTDYTLARLFDRIESIVIDVKKRINQGTPSPDTVLKQQLLRQVREMAEEQAEKDRLILEELHSGAYTLEEPFVLLDPYGISPLTAMLLFTTEKPMRIDIHVAADTPEAEVDFAFSDYETEHMIPVYGLYAARANAVTVTATDEDGHAQSKEVTIQTDVLPKKMAAMSVQAHALDRKAVQPGFTFTYTDIEFPFKTAIDVDGQFRWYLNAFEDGTLLSETGYCGDYNGGKSLFISCGSGDFAGPVVILELNLQGKLLNAWYSPYGAHHDIEPDKTGLLVTGSSGEHIGDLIYHIDTESGEIDKIINYSDHMQITRDQCEEPYQDQESHPFYSFSDWAHINTVVSYQDDLIVSMRNQSTVLRSDWDGNIKWMLCDPTGYYEYYKQFILTPVGDNFEYFYIQHAPEVLPDQDGDPDTVDIILFDNGDWRMDVTDRTSRLIQYRINEKKMTVELIWIWDCDEPWSLMHGDADFLENGNRLGSFEPYDSRLDTTSAYGVEVAEDGHVVWEMWRTDGKNYEYRLDRLPIYTETANDLHIGEPANLFLPEE